MKKPKHPMEVIEEIARAAYASQNRHLISEQLMDLVASVRHYFSPENMPSDLDIRELASKEYEYDDEEHERKVYFLGYKAAIERMKQ